MRAVTILILAAAAAMGVGAATPVALRPEAPRAALGAAGEASRPVRVACIGNSITAGYLLPDPGRQSYPGVLQRLLGEGYEVANFGHSGTTLLRRGHRPYTGKEEYRASLEFVPDIAVIHLGVNDTDPRDWPDFRDDFVEDYLDLIASYRSVNPDVRVIISRLTPLGAAHRRFPTGTEAWRDSINRRIERVAVAAGVELMDLGARLTDRPDLIHDAIHPDSTGAVLMAREAAAAITGRRGPTSLRPVYRPGMVLQRYRPVRIEGFADSGTPLRVGFDGDTVSVTAGTDGRWAALLPPRPEATGLTLTVEAPDTVITLADVAMGEVWIASGQSNMEFRLKDAANAAEVIPVCADSLLRFFTMRPAAVTNSGTWPAELMARVDSLDYYELPESWEGVTPDNAPELSAVAYFFGRRLRDALGVPVGIVANAVGGSTTESWIDIETLWREEPGVLVDWQTNDYIQPWAQGRARLNAPGHRHPYEPSYLFAAGIRPLGQLPVAGTIWYQGESNAHNAEVHERMFRRLVGSWRDALGSADMPFLTVQLSSLDRPSWPAFRDSQRRLAREMPGVWMAVSSDVGDEHDVHPRLKEPVGDRLARIALRRVYGDTGVADSGPEPETARAIPGALEITMSAAEGMHPADGDSIRGFEVAASPFGPFHPAQARVEGNTIILTSMQEPNPAAARYGWQPYTDANLVNSAELPASTFSIAAPADSSATPEEGIERGLSGMFAAALPDGRVMTAGGCNFPTDTPLSPGAVKKFYQGIYAAAPAADGRLDFSRIGSLPEPMAYGATASTPEGVLLIGGSNAGGLSERVWLCDGSGSLREMPSLPYGIDNAAAAAVGPKVYLAGGNGPDGAPGRELLCLDLDNLHHGWQRLKPMPGDARMQPVMAAADGKLYLFGGFAGRTASSEPTLSTDGLCYDPRRCKWSSIEGPREPDGTPLSLGGGAASTLADGRILAIGGVNARIFLDALTAQAPDYLSHPVDWYRFNPYACVFDPSTGHWTVTSSPATARAGASLVILPSDQAVVLGGELKPRIRTPRPAILAPASR